MDDRQGTILRVSALILALVEVLILLDPMFSERIGLSRSFLVVTGSVHVALQLLLAAVPWPRLMADGRFRWLPLVHVLSNVVLLLVPIVIAGGVRAELVWVVAIVLVYAGVILPLRQSATVVGCTTLVLVIGANRADTGDLLVPVVATIGVALLAAVGSRVQTTAVSSATDRSEDAERTAVALRAALDSTGSAVTVNRQRILDAVVEGAARINSDQAGVYWLTPDGRQATYAAAHGIPDHLRGELFDATTGVKGDALRTGRTVVMSDYDNQANAMPEYRATGLKNAIGAPIRVRGQIVGMLVGGRSQGRDYTPDEIATFEQLATNAGQALEMADQVRSDRRLLARLQELDDRKRDFVTMVSHELRTPLTVISGLSETLVTHQDKIDPERTTDLIRRIHANARSLADIVRALLDIGGIDRGITTAERERVDLAALARSIHDRLDPLFVQHIVLLDLPSHAWVVGDAVLLERVVDNLLTNALRHTPAGTSITISVHPRDSDAWELVVRDDGPGIPEADVERIMDRFVRGGPENARPRGGLGLGLSLCREILELHQTRLVVDTSGDGACFRFRLAQEPTSAADRPTAGHDVKLGTR